MRKIAAIAEAHYVTIAPHNPMGPLATAINLHFCAAQPNDRGSTARWRRIRMG